MSLYRMHELALHTQYAELKERVRQGRALLPGTPGSLKLRGSAGGWYRVFYIANARQKEQWICGPGDEATLQLMRESIAFAVWAESQVRLLRKIGFQVADKAVADVLVALYNAGAFEAGLVLVGTLGYMAWLNELGAAATGARTLDIDLARRQPLKLAAPHSFLEQMKATGLPFSAVPGMPSHARSTSVKLPGAQGLRVDVLAHGEVLGAAVPIPEWEWTAQAIPHYDYLLAAPEPGLLLAGGHAVPVNLPQAARLVWHKLYASAARRGEPEKARKDQQQAMTLAAVLAEQGYLAELEDAYALAPAQMKQAIRRRLPAIATLSAHPPLQDLLAGIKAEGGN